MQKRYSPTAPLADPPAPLHPQWGSHHSNGNLHLLRSPHFYRQIIGYGVLNGDAIEGKGPQRRLGRRLEEVAKSLKVGGGYFRLPPLKPALAARETVAGHRLGTLNGGVPLPLPMPSLQRKGPSKRMQGPLGVRRTQYLDPQAAGAPGTPCQRYRRRAPARRWPAC